MQSKNLNPLAPLSTLYLAVLIADIELDARLNQFVTLERKVKNREIKLDHEQETENE
jgi:hypothetical protein